MVVCLVAGVVDSFCFGNGTKGQLGLSRNDSFTSFDRPRMMVQEKGIATLACGAAHTICLLDNGTVFAFGDNEDGQVYLIQSWIINDEYSSQICNIQYSIFNVNV